MQVTPEELARVMVERARRDLDARAERLAKVKAGVVEIVRQALSSGRLERAWIIGSLATGDFAEGSDVDVVTSGLARSDEGELRDALERISAVPVDLLRLEELGADFREAVLRDGEVVR